jgi:hypothetical protein
MSFWWAKKYKWQERFPIHEIGRIDGGKGFQTGGNVFQISGNTFYDQTIMDSNFVVVLYEESPSWGKSTVEDIRQAIVGKLLLIRQPREGEDLKNQWGDWRGSKVKLTPQRSTGRVNRLHHKFAGGNDQQGASQRAR